MDIISSAMMRRSQTLNLEQCRAIASGQTPYLLHVARKHGLRMASLEKLMATLDDPTVPVLFVVS
ncbi:MAG: hypothetical protein QOI77_3690 [Blastocatellia bacterium]|jgi:hypothetical protein|nr:hypothetical protein [Blastocatellia bacterium]